MSLSAWLYDAAMRRPEAMGLAAWRAELLAPLTGRVLELGPGTGLNLRHYPATVDALVLLEPDRGLHRVLAERAAALGRAVELVEGGAESIPLPDASVDAVVATLVLCSVREVEASLAEIRRVLRPGGTYVFLEHVASARPGRRAWQGRVEPLWRCLQGNCHLTRDSEAAIRAAGFALEGCARDETPGEFVLVRESVRGRARRPG